MRQPFFAPLDHAVSRVPVAMVLGVITGIVVYCWSGFKKPNVVCPKCGKCKTEDGSTVCECGDYFVNADEMKWCDDEK